MDVNLNGDDQNRDNSEKKDGMNQYGYATRGHVAALQHPSSRWQLKEKSRR